MTTDLTLGLALGAALGAANAAASYGLWRVARRMSQAGFLKVYFGGMLARLTFALAFVVAIVALTPVHQGAFVGSLLGAFVLGLIAETALVIRSIPRAGALPASAA